jgi:hypothetical protein
VAGGHESIAASVRKVSFLSGYDSRGPFFEEIAMARRLAVAALLMVCVLLRATSPAPAAEDILKLVPESALGFVVINRPADLDAKLQSLAGKLQLPPLSALTMIKQTCKIQEGLDEHGTIGVIALPPDKEGALPIGILLIPVTDYDKFFKPYELKELKEEGVAEVQIFDAQLYTRNIGGYAALTDGSHKEVLSKKNLKIADKPAAALAPWQQWLASKDVAAVILQPGLKAISAKGQEAIRAMKPIMLAQAGEQGKMAAAVFDVYADLLQAAQKEVATAGIALELDKHNVLRLTKRLLLVPGGQCAQLVAEWHAPAQNLLAGLPDEPFVVAGGGALSDAMSEQFMKFSMNLMKSMHDVYGLSDEQIDKMSKAQLQVQGLKGTHSMSMLFGVGQSGQPIFSNAVTVMRVKDSQAYLKDYAKSIAQYNEIVKEAKSPMLPAMELEKSKVGDIPALQLTITMPQVASQVPASAKMIETMYGPGGKLLAWLAPADKETLVLGYVDKKHVLQTIEAIKQGKLGLAGNAGLVKTAASLPSDAVLTGYLSPAGTIDFVKRIMSAILPPEAGFNPNIPEFPKAPPIGMAVTTAHDELQACLVVPPEVLQAIAQYVGKIRAAAASGNGATASPATPATTPAPAKPAAE